MGYVTEFRGKLFIEYNGDSRWDSLDHPAYMEMEDAVIVILKKYSILNYVVKLKLDQGNTTSLVLSDSAKAYGWTDELKNFTSEIKTLKLRMTGVIYAEGEDNMDIVRAYVNTEKDTPVIMVSPIVTWPEDPFEVRYK